MRGDGGRRGAPPTWPAEAPASAAAKVRAGERRAIAGLIRALEDEAPWAREALRLLLAEGAPARVVGVTGPAGAGKSTLVDGLVAHHRARGEKVAVVAVDPSSPHSGGAILGDRVRMQRHATDPGVFVRSLATRGASGGLARAAWDATAVLASAGFPLIYVETTGAGQAEIAVARLADVVVVVNVPGLGDDVQALKAGILEIADVLVVNKADREGADRTAQDLEAMLALRRTTDPTARAVPVVKTVATAQDGLAALVSAIERQHAARSTPPTRDEDRRAHELVLDAVAALARKRADAGLRRGELFRAALAAVAERRADPVEVAEALLDHPEESDTLEG